MRVVVVTGIYPPDHGGPASYVPAICNSIIDKGHQVIGVVTLSDDLQMAKEQNSFPVYRVLRSKKKPLRLYKVISIIWRLSRDADLVYLNGLVLEGVLACKILRRKKIAIKVVGDLVWERAQNDKINVNLEEFQRTRIGFKYEILKKLQSWYTRKADLIITPSHYMAKIITLWGIPSEQIKVIHNGIEAEVPKGIRKKADYDVVVVGRLIPLKRIPHVVEICAKNKWSMRIIGDGPERQTLETLASNISNGIISFSGSIRKDEVPAAIATGKILVLNSIHETFPHVLLEAKSVGVAVVATNVGGIPEMVHDGLDGLLVFPDDASALESAIQSLLDNPEKREQLVGAGMIQVARDFNWNNLSAQTVHALETLAITSAR